MLVGTSHLADEQSTRKQSFRRYTTDVEANTPEFIFLYTRRCQTQLCRADRGYITTRPATYDNEIEALTFLIGQDASL